MKKIIISMFVLGGVFAMNNVSVYAETEIKDSNKIKSEKDQSIAEGANKAKTEEDQPISEGAKQNLIQQTKTFIADETKKIEENTELTEEQKKEKISQIKRLALANMVSDVNEIKDKRAERAERMQRNSEKMPLKLDELFENDEQDVPTTLEIKPENNESEMFNQIKENHEKLVSETKERLDSIDGILNMIKNSDGSVDINERDLQMKKLKHAIVVLREKNEAIEKSEKGLTALQEELPGFIQECSALRSSILLALNSVAEIINNTKISSLDTSIVKFDWNEFVTLRDELNKLQDYLSQRTLDKTLNSKIYTVEKMMDKMKTLISTENINLKKEEKDMLNALTESLSNQISAFKTIDSEIQEGYKGKADGKQNAWKDKRSRDNRIKLSEAIEEILSNNEQLFMQAQKRVKSSNNSNKLKLVDENAQTELPREINKANAAGRLDTLTRVRRSRTSVAG